MKNTNEFSHLSPEQEKIREIMRRSKQFVVISGPSGSGKTMVIKYLVEKYGFIEPPFLTTRKLRIGEQETGGINLSKEDFTKKETENKIFLPAHNYGNSYGYDLDIIFNIAIQGNHVVVEAPASNLVTDVSYFLPESSIVGMLPESKLELEIQLKQRDLSANSDRNIRLQNSETEKEQIIQASAVMNITQIIPTHGIPQDTISKIDIFMKIKGF